MRAQIVFCDVDGTLLDSSHRVLPGTLAAIRALQRQGIAFVIVSGRSPFGIEPILRRCGFRCPMICYSGALILDAQGRELAFQSISGAEARRVIALLEESRLDCVWNLYTRERWLVRDHSDPRVALEESIVWGRAAEGDPARIAANERIGKLLCMCAPQDVPLLERRVKETFPRLSVTRSSDTQIEIMQGGVTKRSAVETLCRLWQIPQENTVAFGDHYNDLEMLESVAVPFLMGNAPPELQRRIPNVTDSNDAEGIRNALVSIGLIPAE